MALGIMIMMIQYLEFSNTFDHVRDNTLFTRKRTLERTSCLKRHQRESAHRAMPFTLFCLYTYEWWGNWRQRFIVSSGMFSSFCHLEEEPEREDANTGLLSSSFNLTFLLAFQRAHHEREIHGKHTAGGSVGLAESLPPYLIWRVRY